MTVSKNKNVDLPNVPTMTVGDAIDSLTGLYGRAIEGCVPFEQMPAAMLWGAPGVGKSQGVRQLGSCIENRTGKRAVVTDVRLILFNPVDLRGIPVANDDKTLAVWLKPKVFDMDPSDEVVNILFMDELSAAPPTVQAAAYQIALDRACGEHRLPGNCIVIAAGNRMSDRSVAYKMPKALSNRLLHIEVDVDYAAWREWAVESGLNGAVVAFLAQHPDRLMSFDPNRDDLAFATPRSWEMAGAVLDGAGGDVESAFPLVAGLVGLGAASEFRTWMGVCGQLPDLDDIFMGLPASVPSGNDALYALVSAMAQRARSCTDDLEAIGNSVQYARKLPPDFSALLLKDYVHLEAGYRQKLASIPGFMEWLNDVGRLINGVI